MKILERKQTPEQPPNLEQLVMSASYRERDNALAELMAAVEKILHPRGGYQSYDRGANLRHFLPIPPAPKVNITQGGIPSGKVDEKEQEEFQRQLTAITLEEKRLVEAAQKAKNKGDVFLKWAQDLGPVEDRLLLSILDEADRPAVMVYLAEHHRFIRTVNSLTDGLKY